MRLVFVAFVAAAAAPLASAQNFKNPQYACDWNPSAVASGDFNGDGRRDAVVANKYSDNISLLLGTGAGFSPAANFSIGGSSDFPNDILAVDVNLDGKLDAVTINDTTFDITVFLGDGAGGFAAPASYHTGASPTKMVAADFNNNGAIDLAITSGTGNKVFVHFGNGAGGFGLPASVGVGLNPQGIAAGDINNNGTIDLVTANKGGNNISVLLGNGAGVFTFVLNVPVIQGPVDVALVDVNNNSNLDAVVAQYHTNTIAILIGTGLGGFSAPVTYTAGNNPNSVAMKDINSDGSLDAVVPYFSQNLNYNSVAVLLNNGGGVFSAPASVSAGAGPNEAVVADFTNDGLEDAAIANSLSNSISLLIGAGGGAFLQINEFNTSTSPTSIDGGDVDGDGLPDVATSSDASGAGTILFGSGGGILANPLALPAAPGSDAVKIVDLNHDHRQDAIVGGGQGKLWLFVQSNTGSFFPGIQITVGGQIEDATAADFNNDGEVDLAAADVINDRVATFAGLGNLQYGPAVYRTTGFDFFTIASPLSLSICDVNNDGALDLLSANLAYPDSSKDSLCVFINNGAGLLTLASVHSTNTILAFPAVASGDVDSDGFADAVLSLVNGGLRLFIGTGLSFGPPQILPAPLGPRAITLVDMNEDAAPDIVTANGRSNSFSIYTNNGFGGFSGPSAFATGANALSLILTDIEADGDLDVAAACYDHDAVSVSINDLPTPFGVARYGYGTAGCRGMLGITANVEPHIGTPNFGVYCTNAPSMSLGFLLVTDAADAPGTDVFSLNLIFHVDVLTASEFFLFDIVSDEGGAAVTAAPIPNDPLLIAKRYYGQTFFVEPPASVCSPAAFGFVSSTAVAISILP